MVGIIMRTHFTRDVIVSANEAIQTYLSPQKLRLAVPTFRLASVAMPQTMLIRYLSDGNFANTDGGVYDEMLSSIADSQSGGSKTWEQLHPGHKFKIAGLALAHPEIPRVDMALSMLRYIEQDASHPFWTVENPRSIAANDHFVYRIVVALQRQNMHSEAAWALNIARLKRARSNGGKSTPYPAPLHRLLKADEAKNGPRVE